MIRQAAAIFLLFSFALQVFNRSVIVLNYFANKTSFAMACENKARPMLHCNGKCQLMKKLKEEEKNEQQNPERKSENKNEVVWAGSFFTTLSAQLAIERKVFCTHHPVSSPQDLSADIFHPPAVG